MDAADARHVTEGVFAIAATLYALWITFLAWMAWRWRRLAPTWSAHNRRLAVGIGVLWVATVVLIVVALEAI